MATSTAVGTRRLPLGLRLPDSMNALAERDFRIVWTGQAISMTGTWMQLIAQGLLVLELWNSALAPGVLNFANALPSLVVMLFGGVLADRADKRRILIITQVVMMLLALTVGVLILADLVEFWMLIVATMILGIAFGYDMPAYQAFLPDLVPPEKISQVVALNSSTFHGTRIVGPAMAGGIIAVLGLAAAYFINAASFVAVIFGLMIIRHRFTPSTTGERVGAIEGLKQGLRHAKGRPNLQVMLMLTAINTTFIFPQLAVLSVYYVKEVLDASDAAYGLLWAGSGVGAVIGAVSLIWWPRQQRSARLWMAAMMSPAAMIVMAVTREPVVAIVAMTFLSFAFSSQLGLIQTMIQESTPAQYRGRVMSLHGITFNGTMPIAGIAAAGLAAWLGLPIVMALAAVCFLAATAWVLQFAGGGIAAVVRRCEVEYEVIAEAAPADPSRV